MLLIAYGSNGRAIGSAKLEKGDETDTELNIAVTLSKDTNVALRTAEDIANGKGGVDGTGKGPTPKDGTTGTGKTDEAAPAQPTGGMPPLAALLPLGGALLALMLAYALLARRGRAGC